VHVATHTHPTLRRVLHAAHSLHAAPHVRCRSGCAANGVDKPLREDFPRLLANLSSVHDYSKESRFAYIQFFCKHALAEDADADIKALVEQRKLDEEARSLKVTMQYSTLRFVNDNADIFQSLLERFAD
jgi:hypothetical protein